MTLFVTAVVTPILFLVLAVPAEAIGDAGQQPAAVTSVAAVAAATHANVPVGAIAIERGHVQAALVQVHASEQPSSAAWTISPGTSTPNGSGNFSVGFDDGQNVASGLPNAFGTRVAILTVLDNGSGFAGTVETLKGIIVTCALNPEIATASALLAAVGPALTCPDASRTGARSTAVTSVWAWGNPIDPAIDDRGLGQAGMAPEALVGFAVSHHLATVFLSVPWAANQGVFADWLSASVDALHANGIHVAALGGDIAWLTRPQLGAQWASDAFHAANFDSVELDLEPWAGVANPNFAVITPQLIASITAVRAAAFGHPVGADLPWWLAARSFGSGTVFDAVVHQLDTVAIIAFADHASGGDGIIQLARPAVASAVAARAQFTIGVETETPAIAGGAQFTFYDSGAAALTAEADKVQTAFSRTSGYRGVSVEHLLSWAALLARS